ncbi:MAG: hypothetical protein LVS60_12905 [Nodosilinea sp. LVE1205-7]
MDAFSPRGEAIGNGQHWHGRMNVRLQALKAKDLMPLAQSLMPAPYRFR